MHIKFIEKLDDYTEIQSEMVKMAPEVPTTDYEDFNKTRIIL
jgi:hypothetical protein